jgi:hypothetical protein
VDELLAGLVCGYALALAATPALALALVRARVSNETVRRLIPEGSSLVAVSIIIHTFALLAMAALGILLGIMLSGIEDSRPAGGLGSPNQIFTAFVIVTGAIAVLPLVIAVPRWRLPLLASGLIFVGTFGWAMPYLALAAGAKS